MQIDIISVEPRMFEGFLAHSIVKRAVEKGACTINLVDLRTYGVGSYHKVDDKPYGGGRGMLMMCEPWFNAVEPLLRPDGKTRVIMTTPSGKRWTQDEARKMAKEEHIVFMCGHYEGFDERIRTLATDEYSIGDFVLTGGELPAATMVDSIVRLLPGVLGGGAEAVENESFASGANILEEPQWTHPAIFRSMAVPEVLLSGDHAKIAAWRKRQAELKTRSRRPDLLASPECRPFDRFFMAMALREAEKAASDGETPTGCIIVEEPEDPAASPNEVRILARAHNQTEDLVDATAHAEILALSSAFQVRGNWRLLKTRLYVTKEPCPMCAGAIALARVPVVVWGASDPKRGGQTTFDIFGNKGMNHHPNVIPGVMEEECRLVLQEFFRKRRNVSG